MTLTTGRSQAQVSNNDTEIPAGIEGKTSDP